MPTKRAVLNELSRDELRIYVNYYDLDVYDLRVRSQLIDALAGCRRAPLDEMLWELSRDRLKELCRTFGLDDSGRKKGDIVERLISPTTASKNTRGARAAPSAPAVKTSESKSARGAKAARSEPPVETADPPPETLGVEQLERYLWSAADILRGSIDSSDYKTYIFGLLFLKRLSDRFEEEAEKLLAEGVPHDVAWTDPDEHQFFVPNRARWGAIQKTATKHRGGAEQGVRGPRGAEPRARGRPRRHRLQRRAQARRREEPRHRARPPRRALLPGLAAQR